jgi:mono/diheme cytochrome c family protein
MKMAFALCSLLAALLFASLSLNSAPVQQAPPGKTAYDRACSVCHGMEGRGDAGPGPSLVPFEKEYREVLGIVREGTGEMPPIAPERLSDDAVKQIVEYLKSLNAAPGR